MTRFTFKLCSGALVAAALVSASPAFALQEGQAGVREALAQAAKGPDQLRWFVQRTRQIYLLDFNEIMALAESNKTANIQSPTKLAQSDRR
jgi:hypothetical protein